jgi:hypothetical protein
VIKEGRVRAFADYTRATEKMSKLFVLGKKEKSSLAATTLQNNYGMLKRCRYYFYAISHLDAPRMVKSGHKF